MSDAALEQFEQMLEPEDPSEETPPEEAPEDTPEEAPVAEADTEEPAAEEEPKLLAGKYKTPEELEQAYSELQKTLGAQGSELGALRDEISKLSEKIPEYEDDDYGVPVDNATMQWFDTAMDENPVQAMEWARKNDPSGVYYNRGLQSWYDTNPAQAGTYQAAVIAQGLREEFQNSLSTQTKPLQEQADKQALNAVWAETKREFPDLDEYGEAMLEEAKASPELLAGANTPEQKKRAITMLYRLAKGSAASTLETARQEADTEQKQANRDAKLSGTAPATRARTPEPEVSEGEAWLEQIGFNKWLTPEDE